MSANDSTHLKNGRLRSFFTTQALILHDRNLAFARGHDLRLRLELAFRLLDLRPLVLDLLDRRFDLDRLLDRLLLRLFEAACRPPSTERSPGPGTAETSSGVMM